MTMLALMLRVCVFGICGITILKLYNGLPIHRILILSSITGITLTAEYLPDNHRREPTLNSAKLLSKNGKTTNSNRLTDWSCMFHDE